MAKLSAEKQKQLDDLLAEQEAPEPAAPNRMTNVTIDLSNDKAVARGVKLGLLDPFDDGDGDDADDADDTDGDGDGDDTPERPSFFGKR